MEEKRECVKQRDRQVIMKLQKEKGPDMKALLSVARKPTEE